MVLLRRFIFPFRRRGYRSPIVIIGYVVPIRFVLMITWDDGPRTVLNSSHSFYSTQNHNFS